MSQTQMKANVKQPKSTSYNSGLCNTILADNTSADRSLKAEHTAWLLCLLIHSVVLRDLQYWVTSFYTNLKNEFVSCHVRYLQGVGGTVNRINYFNWYFGLIPCL